MAQDIQDAAEFFHARQGLPNNFTLAQLHRALKQKFAQLSEDNHYHNMTRFTVGCIGDIAIVRAKNPRLRSFFRISGDLVRSIDIAFETPHNIIVMQVDASLLHRFDNIKLSWKKCLGIIDVFTLDGMVLIYADNVPPAIGLILRDLVLWDCICVHDHAFARLVARVNGRVVYGIPISEKFVQRMRAHLATHDEAAADLKEKMAGMFNDETYAVVREILPELAPVES
jgi:hypothetical protein